MNRFFNFKGRRGRKNLRFALLSALLLLTAFYFGSRFASSKQDSFPVGLLASASCENKGAILSTGSFNGSSEILYYLDSQSGRLSAGLLSRSEPSFVKTYTRNVKADLQKAANDLGNVPFPANPQFIMVSGEADIRNIGAGEMNNLAKSFLYVAEVQTGIVLVYILPLEGDRDIEVNKGEIIFWTFARLNAGTGTIREN